MRSEPPPADRRRADDLRRDASEASVRAGMLHAAADLLGEPASREFSLGRLAEIDMPGADSREVFHDVVELLASGAPTNVMCDHAADRLAGFGAHLWSEGAPIAVDLADDGRSRGVAWLHDPVPEPCNCGEHHPDVAGFAWTRLPGRDAAAAVAIGLSPAHDGSPGRMHVASDWIVIDDAASAHIEALPGADDPDGYVAGVMWKARVVRGLLATHRVGYLPCPGE